MTYRLIILFFTFLTAATSVCGQALEPLDLAKKIFGKDKFADLKKFIAGEYKGHPNGQDLQKGSTTRFLLLEQKADKAVVAMTVLDSNGRGIDAYLHFEKSPTWKMHAFRALAMTGIIEQVKNNLEKLTSEQVDERIEEAKKSGNAHHSLFASREEYDFELGNTRLTLELDDNILKHFLVNKAAFEGIKEAALKELENKNMDADRSIKLAESLRSEYRKLFISSVSYGGYNLGGKCLSFTIGGILDNTVGYLFVRNKEDVPEMNDHQVIMIREIGEGWYIYKTT